MLKSILSMVSVLIIISEFIGFIFLLEIRMLRKTINQQPCKVKEKALYEERNTMVIICDILIIVSFSLALLVALSFLFSYMLDVSPSFFKALYNVSITMVILPNVLDLTKEKVKAEMTGLDIALVVVATLLVFLGKLEIDEKIKGNLMTIVLSVYLILLIWAIVQANRGRKKKRVSKFHKKIYKDLFYRTPNLSIQGNTYEELRKECEKYYSMFIKSLQKYNKKENLQSISFGTPFNKTDDWFWYRRATKIVKYASLISELIICMDAIIEFKLWKMWFVGGFLILYFLVYSLKKWDQKNEEDYFKRIIIRIYYDEWGYFLKGKKTKFVGSVQLLEIGYKYDLIHSMLNIAAFCRIIAFEDLTYRTNKISRIANEMFELFISYSEHKDWNWIELIPILIVAVFEYNNTGMISQNLKGLLEEYKFTNYEKQEIKQFLQGLWVDITGHMENVAGYKMIQGLLDCYM